MMYPTILRLLFCLSVPYVNSNLSEESNVELAENIRLDLNNFNSDVDETNNRSESDEHLNHEKTSNDNDNSLNSLRSSNLLNGSNVQVSGEVDDSYSLKNLESSFKAVDGVYDFTQPLNNMDNVNLLRLSNRLKGVNNPVEDKSAGVNRNGHDDRSILSALLAPNRLGVRQNRVDRLSRSNVLARNGESSTVDLDRLDNEKVQMAQERKLLDENKLSDYNANINRYFWNQFKSSDSSNLEEGNDLDKTSNDILDVKSNQVASVSLNQLKEDSKNGLVKLVRIDKAQLLGRSGNEFDEDNLLNAIESHNEGELNTLSALASISNLDDSIYGRSSLSTKSLLNSNNNENREVKAVSVESESDENESENLNIVQKSSLTDANSLESASFSPSNNRRSSYFNNQFLNKLRLTHGRNQQLDQSVPILPYNRPVPINPYRYYDSQLKPYRMNNYQNIGISPYGLISKSGLKSNENLNTGEKLSAGLADESNSNNLDKSANDIPVDLNDDNVDVLLDTFNKDELNSLSLGKNDITLKSSQNRNPEDVNDFDNLLVVVDASDVNDLNQVEVDILNGRKMLFPLRNLNLLTDVDTANRSDNLKTKSARRQRPRNKNIDSVPVEVSNNLASDKIGMLHGVFKLTQEEELSLDEARQIVAEGLRRSARRHF